MHPLDPDIAGQLAADLPPEDFRRILDTLREDLARLGGELTACAGRGEASGFHRAAHSLAGAAAAVGALRLEAAARRAMLAGRADPALVPPILQEGEVAMAALLALLPPGLR